MSRTAPAPPPPLTTPRPDDLGLRHIRNSSGLLFSLLPNGGLFALEHAHPDGRILINRTLGSPIAGGLERLWLRIGGSAPAVAPIAGAAARGRLGAGDLSFVWSGETAGLRHEVRLRLDPHRSLWRWCVEVTNTGAATLSCDCVLIQDLGLGARAFLMNNEAYASQYLDHHIAHHARIGPVLMSRQNLPQNGRHPWVAHACLPAAVSFATDHYPLMGPAHRDADGFALPFGTSLPSRRLQHESGCAALQSSPVELARGGSASWSFLALYCADHAGASADADLALIDAALTDAALTDASREPPVALACATRSLLQDAASAAADSFDGEELSARYPRQTHIERAAGRVMSFFTPGDGGDRHVVLRDKERQVLRRHGALLRSGDALLPDERTLCVTCWMHGVFGAQLAIGNTSFHRLFSV